MFTGLIAETGAVQSMAPQPGGGGVLTVSAGIVASAAATGDSISVNGVCLTVTNLAGKGGAPTGKGGALAFELSPETLRSSNLSELKPGGKVNLEPSLKAGQPLGGHFVTGHVDATGIIRSRKKEGNAFVFDIKAPPEVTGFLVEKGSVALDGISLTVVDVLNDGFTVVIIPHTALVTNIGGKGPGDTVNLEADILGKYVARFLSRGHGGTGGGAPGARGGAPGARGDATLLDSLVKSGFIDG